MTGVFSVTIRLEDSRQSALGVSRTCVKETLYDGIAFQVSRSLAMHHYSAVGRDRNEGPEVQSRPQVERQAEEPLIQTTTMCRVTNWFCVFTPISLQHKPIPLDPLPDNNAGARIYLFPTHGSLASYL